MMPPALALLLAIVSEVVATSALKASAQFSRPLPTLLSIAGYLAAFWLLSKALVRIPVGVAYAIWSGAGIVLISLVGWLLFGQRLDHAALAGIALILAGVLVLQLFSKTV